MYIVQYFTIDILEEKVFIKIVKFCNLYKQTHKFYRYNISLENDFVCL